jgi:hypothetical protein
LLGAQSHRQPERAILDALQSDVEHQRPQVVLPHLLLTFMLGRYQAGVQQGRDPPAEIIGRETVRGHTHFILGPAHQCLKRRAADTGLLDAHGLHSGPHRLLDADQRRSRINRLVEEDVRQFAV